MKRIAPCSGLAFVAVLCSLAGPALGEEEPCGARILGDSDAAQSVSEAIDGNSLAAEDCRPVQVAVSSRGDLLVLDLDDGTRRARRLASTPAAAATVILAWSQRPGEPIAREPAATEPVGSSAPRPAVDREMPAELLPARPRVTRASPGSPKGRPRSAIAIGAESSGDSDGLLWVGGRVAACATVGPFCIGGLGRLSDSRPRALSPAYHTVGTAWDVLGQVSLPGRLGRVHVAPALYAGWASVRLRELRGGPIPLPGMPDDTAEYELRGLRAGGEVSASHPLGKGVSFRLTVGADYFAGSRDDTAATRTRAQLRGSVGFVIHGFGG